MYEVPQFWDWIKGAVFSCTRTGRPQARYGIAASRNSEFLRIRLPSRRYIYYYLPEIKSIPAPWDVKQRIMAFTYMGKNSFTQQWTRISAHAGGLTENVVQAIARDVLGFHMVKMDEAGIDIRLHVHDEVGSLNKKSRLSEMIDIMRISPPWMPELNLDAAGFTCKRYHKG